MYERLSRQNNREIDFKLFLMLEISDRYSFEIDMNLNSCSLKSKILPQILSEGADFLPVVCNIILSKKISFYSIIQGILQKDYFFQQATHKNSQKTLINSTYELKTLQMTCQEFHAQCRHHNAAPSRVF